MSSPEQVRLPAGFYRLTSMLRTINHQPVVLSSPELYGAANDVVYVGVPATISGNTWSHFPALEFEVVANGTTNSSEPISTATNKAPGLKKTPIIGSAVAG
ncbi:hypothetical protein HGRIS_002968 [Hohenbuehelia grisea]|uniref:Uncharacterized protein n=1 Tax=Hohenbuehelia grisea TaxID=104357 RepID=A0ABR3JP12_9AGAR